MSSSKEQLAGLLEQLHAELAKIGDVEPGLRRELASVAEDIRRVLRDPEAAGNDERDQESFASRLKAATEQFEDAHPHLISAANAVGEALSRLGI